MFRATLLLGSVIALVAASPASAADGLAGWWPFDEGAGTVARDASGNGNNGTFLGAPQWTQGYFGTALSFDGGTADVEIPSSSSLEPAASVSVAAWVKGTAPEGTFKSIIAKGVSGCSAASYALYTGPSGGLMFYVSQNRGLTYTRSPDANASVWDGSWHFVVGTYDGAKVRLYVDGTQVGDGKPLTGAIGYGLPDGNRLAIGHYQGCDQLNFKGSIDEPMVWTRALSASEIASSYSALVALHAGRPAGPTVPLPPPSSPPNGAPLSPVFGRLPTVVPPAAISSVMANGFARGTPSLGFTVVRDATRSPIKSLALAVPRGLHFVRNLRQIRAGVNLSHAGKYRASLSHGRLRLVLVTPVRRLALRLSGPALTEDAALIRRVHGVLAYNRIKTHHTKKLLRLTLAMRMTDAHRQSSPVNVVVRVA